MNILCFVGNHKWSQGHFMWNPPRYEWCCERCSKKRVHVRKENKMEHTRAFIRELLKLVNMNAGPLKPDIQELYYKADNEMKEVEGKLIEVVK